MNITKTTNSALALNTSMDASYISRLRRGKRGLSRNQNYVQAMCLYFAKHCREDYQLKALSDVMNVETALLTNNDNTVKLLYSWLINEIKDESKKVESFLKDISHFKFNKSLEFTINNEMPKVPEKETSVYFGDEGKRQAVEIFLLSIIRENTPNIIYLFSDEDMNWMTKDRVFMAKWAALMTQVIIKGNKIKIIHTVNRHLDEMLTSIKEWIPLYITGAIEPYYYPKKRDGIYKRTLFVIPGTAAVVSTSVGNMADKKAIFFLRDKNAVEALYLEFNNYLSLCRPLVKIFNSKTKYEYMSTLLEFENEDADIIIKTDSLFSITMPLSVAEKIANRLDETEKELFLQYHKKRIVNFKKFLAKNKYSEIIKLPREEKIKDGRVKTSFSHIFGNENLYYTEEEYREHIEHIKLLNKSYKNFNVHFIKDKKEDGYMLYVKEDLGAIIAKIETPSVVFALNESNMTAALWNYMEGNL